MPNIPRKNERNPNILLTDFVNAEAKRTGLGLDTYDADWFIATIQTWLGQRGAVLTETGVRKLRRR